MAFGFITRHINNESGINNVRTVCGRIVKRTYQAFDLARFHRIQPSSHRQPPITAIKSVSSSLKAREELDEGDLVVFTTEGVDKILDNLSVRKVAAKRGGSAAAMGILVDPNIALESMLERILYSRAE